MLPTERAVLVKLQPFRRLLLVLRRRVIPFLALSALQCHNFPHLLILTDSEVRRLFAGQSDEVMR